MKNALLCPNCGEIAVENARIYNDSMRKQKINISPVLPSCKLCGAEINVSHTCNGGKIIVLNGTCGSGKTTVAEVLQDRGFFAIDGDCAVQSLRHKKGTKQYDWGELINEIAHEIDVLSLFGKNLVLSHVVLPEDLEKYLEIFNARNMEYKFILLKPEYDRAAERCRTRTCHESATPEIWIKHFYETLVFADGTTEIIDNTNQTPAETADVVLGLAYKKTGNAVQ